MAKFRIFYVEERYVDVEAPRMIDAVKDFRKTFTTDGQITMSKPYRTDTRQTLIVIPDGRPAQTRVHDAEKNGLEWKPGVS